MAEGKGVVVCGGDGCVWRAVQCSVNECSDCGMRDLRHDMCAINPAGMSTSNANQLGCCAVLSCFLDPRVSVLKCMNEDG